VSLLTDTQSIPDDPEYDWHMIDYILKVECRRTADDTYQLRTPSNIVTVNSEGFSLYRTDISAFEQWLDDHQIAVFSRNDVR
jgi:hypothetical protein